MKIIDLIELQRNQYGRLTDADQEDILVEYQTGLRLGVNREIRWANDLESICARFVRRCSESSDIPLFWIRLHGLLTEISYVKPADAPANNAQQHIFDIVVEASIRYNAIRCELTDDEIIYIDYQRSFEAHLFADTFFLHRKSPKKGLRRERRIPALNKVVPFSEIREAVDRVELAGKPEIVAHSLACRIHRPVSYFAEYLRTPVQLGKT